MAFLVVEGEAHLGLRLGSWSRVGSGSCWDVVLVVRRHFVVLNQLRGYDAAVSEAEVRF